MKTTDESKRYNYVRAENGKLLGQNHGQCEKEINVSFLKNKTKFSNFKR